MPRARRLSMLAASAALLLSSSTTVSAIGPSLLMFYGGDLSHSVFFRPGNPSYNPTGFLWNPVTGGARYGTWQNSTIPPNLEGRPYVSFAVFWKWVDDPATLLPTDASQHGRVYLPTPSAAAVVVVTAPRMVNGSGGPPEPLPVPASLRDFLAGWALSPEQTAVLRNLAVF
ncbi:MAG: hypothetical protein IT184_12825 [Acidobacteria bacterium]|nr:hypothetical protein [Acidobacteriota bacterium]